MKDYRPTNFSISGSKIMGFRLLLKIVFVSSAKNLEKYILLKMVFTKFLEV